PASGHFTIGGAWPATVNGRPQLIDLYGSATLYDSLPHLPDDHDRQYHHEARELPDGRLLAMEEIPVSRPAGGTFDGFRVMLVDPETDQVDFSYSSQRAFDEGHLRGGGGDVYHANWADVVDGVLYVSLCYASSVVAIDVPSGDWRWRFGPQQGDFTLQDANGDPIPDNEYPQCQHGLQVRGNRLLVYDNGNNGRNYSRAVEYLLDESTMTATKLWDWTEDDWFQRAMGGVDYTTGGNVLIAAGHLESFTPTPGDRSTFLEIDPGTGDKLWEVKYGDRVDSAYRAEAIAPCALFANAKYCPVVETRLENLAPVLAP
ncbi:MAG: aryl-sulfate sulfotransferase, partial [Myxococcota bacterium]